MTRAPQKKRTFFITFNAWGRRPIFRSDRFAQLMIEILRDGMRKKKFTIHAFVIMPDHLHILITPDYLISLEKAVQLIKGGFSFRAKKDLGSEMEIWQPSLTNHRIINEDDFARHVNYIICNPARAKLAADYPYVYPKAGAKARAIKVPVSLG